MGLAVGPVWLWGGSGCGALGLELATLLPLQGSSSEFEVVAAEAQGCPQLLQLPFLPRDGNI